MSKQPYVMHLVFHPKSEECRRIARNIHQQLNSDSAVPGLKFPTVFVPFDSIFQPPIKIALDIACHSFVVLLADDEMATDNNWCRMVAEVWLACNESENGKHRCIPIQLTKNAWPLDDQLEEVSFARAFAEPEGLQRDSWIVRRIIIELCRFLKGIDTTDDKSRAPLELFLSHSKEDMITEPRVAQEFIDYLKVDQPVEAWVDSGSIRTGTKFNEAICEGVLRSSLLTILTDNYSSREWCREEIMLAKENQRPIAVVDALMKHEVRSFPFLDNVPRMRWNGSPQAGIDLLLKETLRHLYMRTILESSKTSNDIILLRPPEPAALLGVRPGSTVLYPDPPLGRGELQRLSKSDVIFSTPLERLGYGCPLKGKLIALSMSDSSDIAQCGMDNLHLTQTMLELSRYLLISGASLAYGGHLGAQGYTEKLFELVRSHNNLECVDPFERIINHRGWPMPKLATSELASLKRVSTIVSIPRPDDIDESLAPELVAEPKVFLSGDKSPQLRYAWCRGMTAIRAFQADVSRSNVVARIVLGGTFEQTMRANEDDTVTEKWYSSRMPGVLEEVLLSIQARQPVFLIGAFGGVAKLVIDLLLGNGHHAVSWDVQSQAPYAAEIRELYAERNQQWWYYGDEPRISNLSTEENRSIIKFLADAWELKPENGWETSINPLTREQNLELFETVDLARMVELLKIGMNGIK